jgi:hypothetical protein
MTGRGGRHASEGSTSFYRDLAVMIGGIVLVGAAVFFVLILLADNPADTTTTTTPTAAGSSTTVGSTSSTAETSTTSTTAPQSTTVPLRPPAEVRVIVLNSIGLAGAAGRLTDELAAAGYQTLPADDFTPEQDPSRIWYREGFSAEANALLAFVEGALVEAIPDPATGEGADVVIVLGTGYQE